MEGVQRRLQLGVAVARSLHGVAVDTERDVVQKWAAVDLGHVDPALEPGREGVEGSEQVVPDDSQIEGEVVARPGGEADERQVVLRRRSGNNRQRAVTAGHAQRVSSLVDGDRNERREIVCRSEHDRLDASFACSISEGRPRCLAVAGSRVDQQHGPPRRTDALPFFSQSSKTGGHAHHRTLVSRHRRKTLSLAASSISSTWEWPTPVGGRE